MNLIKLGLLKQFFEDYSVLRAEKLTVSEVVQNVPSSKIMITIARHE